MMMTMSPTRSPIMFCTFPPLSKWLSGYMMQMSLYRSYPDTSLIMQKEPEPLTEHSPSIQLPVAL